MGATAGSGGGRFGFPWAGGGIPQNALDKMYLRKFCLEVAYKIFLINVFQILHSNSFNKILQFVKPILVLAFVLRQIVCKLKTEL